MRWTSYHGTSFSAAAAIVAGAVDIALGGGELGQGFYTGEKLYVAKQWAFHVSGDRQQNVVQFESNDVDVFALNILLLDSLQAGRLRYTIKRNGHTRDYLFGCDIVWAPIVGSAKVNTDQFKWESKPSEDLLNDSVRTLKSII